MRLVPTGFFEISPAIAGMLTAAAVACGLVIGPLLARWANRLCEQSPQPREAWIVTAATALLFGIASFAILALEGQRVHEVLPDPPWRFGRWMAHLLLIALLIEATVTDLREYIIPDGVTWIGTILGITIATVSGDTQLIHLWVDWNHPLADVQGALIPEWFKDHPHWHGLAWSLCGVASGAGLTWIARYASSRILAEEAMGLGDVTLMAMIGSFLGWQPVLLVFVLAPLCAIVVGLCAKLMLNRAFIPYGPFLSLAALIVMLGWKWIWQWEPLPHVSLRSLFGDPIGLSILLGIAGVLFLSLLGIARWWRGGASNGQRFDDRDFKNRDASAPVSGKSE